MSNREILLMFNSPHASQKDIDAKLIWINPILNIVEMDPYIATAHEVIDLNKRKIFNGQKVVLTLMRKKKNIGRFIFFNNKN